jgi:hypothetical protein
VSTLGTGDVVQVKVRAFYPVISNTMMFTRVVVAKRPTPTFAADIMPILSARCQGCHLPGGSSGIPWYDSDIYGNLVAGGDAAAWPGPSSWYEGMPRVMPGFPEFSEMWSCLISTDSNFRCPYMRPALAKYPIS